MYYMYLRYTLQSASRGRGRQPITCIDNLKNDTELDDVEEIRDVMSDREDRRKIKSGRMNIRHS